MKRIRADKSIFVMIFMLAFALPAFSAISPKVDVESAFAVTAVEVTPDGSTIVAAFADGTIRQFKSTGHFKSSIKLPYAIRGIALTDNGKKLLVAADKLYLLELESNRISAFEGSDNKFYAVAADKAGKTGVTTTGSAIAFHNLVSGKQTLMLRMPSEIHALAIDDTTATLLTGGRDGVIRAFSLTTGQFTAEANADLGVIRDIAVSAKGILAAGERGVAFLSKDLERQLFLSRHSDDVRSVKATPDGRFSVSGGDDEVPVIWDILLDAATSSYLDVKQPITAAAIDPYFRYIVVGTSATGNTSGMLSIQYTANRNEVRNIYAFRDATAILTKEGYADGEGAFGRYITYEDGGEKYSFADVAQVVHKPEKLDYAMPRPAIADATGQIKESPAFADTEPPVITISQRGFAQVDAKNISSIEGKIKDKSGVAWAKVDGKPLALSPKGEFKIEQVISEPKTIIISAADIYGNTAEVSVTLTAPADAQSKPISNGKKYALLIGINSYKHMPSLTTPEYDVKTLAQVLKANYGYEIETLTGSSATRSAIMSAINTIRRKASPNDKLIVYYAGHGVRDEATGNAYWQPHNAAPDEDTEWILASQLTSSFAAYEAPVLIVSDSCYAGAIRNKNGITGSNNVALIAGGGDEPVTDIGNEGHSVFSGALIASLRKTPGTARELFDMLKTSMPHDGQQPEYHILSGERDFQLN